MSRMLYIDKTPGGACLGSRFGRENTMECVLLAHKNSQSLMIDRHTSLSSFGFGVMKTLALHGVLRGRPFP